MSALQTIACLIAHAPITPTFLGAGVTEENEVQRNNKIPGWDDWLHDNSVTAYIANGDTGRVRAQAWGVSNPVRNFRSMVAARFLFQFVLNPDQIGFPGERYQFTASVRSEGRFLHTAAVPYPDDPREPLARTAGQLGTSLDVLQILPTGAPQAIAARVNANDLVRLLDPTQALEDVIDTSVPVAQDFFPNGQNPVVFRVERTVLGAATGVFSDIRIRGSEGRKNFRVRVLKPRVHKVLDEADPCFTVLRGG